MIAPGEIRALIEQAHRGDDGALGRLLAAYCNYLWVLARTGLDAPAVEIILTKAATASTAAGTVGLAATPAPIAGLQVVSTGTTSSSTPTRAAPRC